MVALVKQKQTVAKKAATLVVSPTPGEGDYTSIQAAINALPASGGTIFLREGTYSISSTITLPDKPVVIIGAGTNATKIDIGSNSIAVFTIPYARRYRFEDLTLYGNGSSGQIGIDFTNGATVVCRNVLFGDGAVGKYILTALQRLSGSYPTVYLYQCSHEGLGGGTLVYTGSYITLYLYGVKVGYSSIQSGNYVYAQDCSFSSMNGSLYVQILYGCSVTGNSVYVAQAAISCSFGNGVIVYPSSTRVRIVGNYFYGTDIARHIYCNSYDETLITSNYFVPISGSLTENIRTSRKYLTVTGNTNCKVVEESGADENFYSGNYGFSGSTIIGAKSRVGHDRGVRIVSANTTLDETYDTVLVDASGGARTITLPTAASMKHRSFTIKKTDSSANAVTVDGNGSETIDGSLTVTLSNQYDFITIYSDGSSWSIVARSAAGGASGEYRNIRTVSANTTLSSTDDVVLVNAASGAITISLPQASTVNKKVFDIKKIDSSTNAVTIDPYGSETIDGQTTISLSSQYQSRTVVTDGTAWYII